MEPLPGNPQEIEGVLNPAAIRGPDGALYLFPRIVAKGNYSRIGIAKVKFDKAGDPVGVDRLGIALEPKEAYELRPNGGGCEDPRISFVEPLHQYVMTYTAFSPHGPRIAVAVSKDLFHWDRLGLARFVPENGMAIDDIDDKDATVFPMAIPSASGIAEMGMLHRPLFPGTRALETAEMPVSRTLDIDRESIWISHCAMTLGGSEPYRLPLFTSHKRLASPVNAWERLKIGAGTPPILTNHGWLIVYHGVSDLTPESSDGHRLCYSAGIMVLSKDDPCHIVFRSRGPVLTPDLPEDRDGTTADIVFPTGIDRRDDLGMPNRFDLYYGMSDRRIGVARLDLQDVLPPDRTADPVRGKA